MQATAGRPDLRFIYHFLRAWRFASFLFLWNLKIRSNCASEGVSHTTDNFQSTWSYWRRRKERNWMQNDRVAERAPAWFLFYQDPKKNRTKIGHWSHSDYAIFQAQISMIKSWHVHVKIINSALTAAKTSWKSNFESTNLASNGLSAYHIHGDTRAREA